MAASRQKPRRRQRATKPRPKRPPVVIVGSGRVGGALATGLSRAGWPVAVLPRSGESVRRVARAGLRLADHEDLRSAALCFVAVPDATVPEAAALVGEDLGPQTALVHCSGALPLTVFGNAPTRPMASFHPLAAVSDAADSLAGHWVAVAATTLQVKQHLFTLAGDLDMHALEVPETGRAAYHAGAVLSAGLLVALADVAVSVTEQAGLDRDTALQALLPLMRSALSGVQQRGLARALTGPVVRGDVGVVQAHLEAMPPELGAIYRLLSRRALGLVEGSLPAETRNALARLLA